MAVSKSVVSASSVSCEDAEATAASPFAIDMWTLHSGATYALTHFFQGKEGASLDQYVRTGAKVQRWFECRDCGYGSRSEIVYGPER